MFRHVGHRLRGAGELAGAFVPTRLDVASRGVVQITRRIEKELCLSLRAVFPRGANALVGPVEVTAGSVIGVFGTRAFGRRGQVRVPSVESSCVAGMIDGTGQVVSRGANLTGAADRPVPSCGWLGGRDPSPAPSSL